MAGRGSKHSRPKAGKVGKRVASPRATRRAAADSPSRRAPQPRAPQPSAPLPSDKRRRAQQPRPSQALSSPDELTTESSAADAPPALPEGAPASRPRKSFPVIGIGMSAGGLEALERFLKGVPEQSGMAYVVVQHLDPTHSGMLVELLRRASPLSIEEVTDGVLVEPDHVYVIPPNKDLSLSRGKLYLFPQPGPPGVHLSIDFFFRSLADDLQERSVGVILSGMGSDGTLGLRAIKEKAGACFVQALSSAKFEGMPGSAIAAGLADVVAPVEELPSRILEYLHHAPHINRPSLELKDQTLNALEKVYVLLRSHTGSDFSLYKKSTIYRRIERRMGLHQIDSIANYTRFLRENPSEIELLFKELLIGVTSFFRDPESWHLLQHDALPVLLAAGTGNGVLRAWIAGCSTGEEAYSLAIVFKEAIEPFRSVRNVTLQIFATDLDRDAIDKARQGLYPTNIAADVSPERLHRFFVQEERGYRVGKEIREMVVFAPQNIIMDPPFTKLDLISCRNLLIYLSGELQKKLIPLFHYSMNPNGLLFLGNAETVGAYSGLFAPLDNKVRLYRRLDQPTVGVSVEFPTVGLPELQGSSHHQEPTQQTKSAAGNLQSVVDRVIIQRFSPVGVLCNDKGNVLYISGRAGKYLEPAVGRANLNLFSMARDGLRHELLRAFASALRQEGAVLVNGLKLGANGGTQYVNLTVQKLAEPKELRGSVMVIMADAQAAPNAPQRRGSREAPHVAELAQELNRAREEAQTTREEMQTSQEELKSTNEELQSTNEELQSTNEELTTSKEEMQSLNEELQTVNHELQSKVDELSRSNNDMKNLLNSTDIATLFLDRELHVRRFTTPTSRIIKLIPNDIGRPITDIASELEDEHLFDDAREVLRTLVFKEKQIATRDGRWFAVRIMPYRTLDNVIDGVVITFTDASAAKALERALREQASELRQMAEALPDLVWSCQTDGTCNYLSPQWLEYTGVPSSEHLGFGWLERVHAEDRERVREEWRAAVKAGTRFDGEFRLRSSTGTYRWFKARAVPIRNAAGAIVKWYGANADVDGLARPGAERQLALDGG
jgi:two-component system, chemotaxis family, CheB/CheR fusion protein